MKNPPVFGAFIKQLRLKHNMGLRQFAAAIGISPEYQSNLEAGRRGSPGTDILQRIIAVLQLDAAQTAELYDCAARSKNAENTVPEDLTGFLHSNPVVVAALRTVRDLGGTDQDWIDFIQTLKNNKLPE